jgi:hypothetical protein
MTDDGEGPGKGSLAGLAESLRSSGDQRGGRWLGGGATTTSRRRGGEKSRATVKEQRQGERRGEDIFDSLMDCSSG